MTLQVGERAWHLTGGNDGVMVGDLRRVEHTLGLRQRLAPKGAHQLSVWSHTRKLSLEEAVHDLRTLGIDIVAEEGGINTRIGGQLHLVELLDEVERHLGRKAELTVAVHLQRGEVVERRRLLLAVLLLYVGDGEGTALDGGKGLLALLLAGELALRSSEGGVAIDGGQHPVGLGLEVVYLLLAVDDEGECGCLHTTDAEHLSVLPVLDGIEARGIDAEQPVADGTRESGEVERLIFRLVLQLGKALTDGFVGHRRYPQSAHGALGLCLLHHPPLYELSLLAGVTTVDDAVGSLHQPLDDGKLLLHAFVFLQAYAELRGNHGQRRQVPRTPHGGIVLGHLQFTKMAEGPCHLIAVAFIEAVTAGRRSYDAGYVSGNTGFLCYTNKHTINYTDSWACRANRSR